MNRKMDRWMGSLIKHVPNDLRVTMNMHYRDRAVRVGVVLFTPHRRPLRTL